MELKRRFSNLSFNFSKSSATYNKALFISLLKRSLDHACVKTCRSSWQVATGSLSFLRSLLRQWPMVTRVVPQKQYWEDLARATSARLNPKIHDGDCPRIPTSSFCSYSLRARSVPRDVHDRRSWHGTIFGKG